MTTRIGAMVFVDPSEIRHSVINGRPVLTFGQWPSVERVDLHFEDVAGVDAVIAELTALRAEMTGEAAPNPPYHAQDRGKMCLASDRRYVCTAQDGHDGPEHVAYGSRGEVCHRWPVADGEPAPVITDSDRDCPAVNPDGSGEHCHKSGPHKTHRDSNGDTWAGELQGVAS